MSGAVSEKSPFFRPTRRKSSLNKGSNRRSNRIGGQSKSHNVAPTKNRRSSSKARGGLSSSLSHSSRSATSLPLQSQSSSTLSSSNESLTETEAEEAAQAQIGEEHKSTIVGCSSNLVNAIVGAGIVGIPYAIQESGLLPGIGLVLFSAMMTEKSLRLLIETAKHANTPSYETLAEACYGKSGFLFISINMFIMAYGALLSYLMIMKDTFSTIVGIDPQDYESQRYLLLIISFCIVLPLSCQRDMADLAKTSKMNVVLDSIIVVIVVYIARAQLTPTSIVTTLTATTDDDNTNEMNLFEIPYHTIFIGLGVLSFAFVCQHSSFIIAGSLNKPTQERWSQVTRLGVRAASSLALVMGICGYLGYHSGDGTAAITGNILNSLPTDSLVANIARGLLGITMLFVYPLESFVARHVCVVLLFQGREAHEGDHSSMLNRRDRRLTITTLIYLLAVIPAALCTDLGNVLAITGSIGGSSLSYIGPGITYIGIHGGRFLELSEQYFETSNNSFSKVWKKFLWYLLGMPLWTTLATIGKQQVTNHVTEMALKSPHPIRIGKVRYAQHRRTKSMYTKMQHDSQSNDTTTTTYKTTRVVTRATSLHTVAKNCENSKVNTMMDGTIAALPPSAFRSGGGYESINTKIGAHALQLQQDCPHDSEDSDSEDDSELEEDPQREPPSIMDFMIAISYIIFGVIALSAGLMSIFLGGGKDAAEIG